MFFQFYRQTKSSRLQLVSLLTLIKLIETSNDISKELLKNEDVLNRLLNVMNLKEPLLISNALESLVYLSIYPEVKEWIIRNRAWTEIIFSYLRTKEDLFTGNLYAVVSILMNLVSYQKEVTEEEKQMQKLHQIAQSLPPTDKRNEDEAVTERIDKLVSLGIISDLATLKTNSTNVIKCISIILCSIARNQKHRGSMVQSGICPLLLKYCNSLTGDDIWIAAHTLAKIIITTNPHMAFKGEIINELIRPLVYLLTTTKSQLQQFESLMALTNLAGVNDTVRSRILVLDCIVFIENLQFSNHNLMKRASTELLCNLVYHPVMFNRYLDSKFGPSLQVMTALADDDDLPTRKAASGTLAVLSSEPAAIPLLMKQTRFFTICLNLLQEQDIEIVHRGSELIKNVLMHKSACMDVSRDIINQMKILTKNPNPTISGLNKEGLMNGMKNGIKI
jgi:hypothetical protein